VGRPPKPLEVKRRLGNPGKRALPRRRSLPGLEPVDPEAVWRSPTSLPLDAPWLVATDLPTVCLLREALEEREELREAVMARHGKRSDLRALDRQIVGLLAKLGLNPTARARITAGEIRKFPNS
jgi:hypothetical protein